MIQYNKAKLNKILEFLIQGTIYTKILIITRGVNDIEDYEFKYSLEVSELRKIHAAKLLLSCAGHYLPKNQ